MNCSLFGLFFFNFAVQYEKKKERKNVNPLITMPNITIDFRHLVESKNNDSQMTRTTRRRKRKHDESLVDPFTQEAYRIYQHINNLKKFLVSIRPAYLSSTNRPSRLAAGRSTKSEAQGDSHSLFSIFSGDITHLTDRERDEIDFQAKLIIRRCMDRIKELEDFEKERHEKESAKPVSRLAHFFNAVLSSATEEDTLNVHRSSMTWFLNQKLTQVSKIQKDQQEIRLNREIEKSENQLSKSIFAHPPPDYTITGATTGADNLEATVQRQEYVEEEENPFEEELTNDQIQMLEKENSLMLEELNNTLNQVRNAEKALLEISTLQNQLTSHLAAQTIQTDRLYADAIATTEKVSQGNLQLISARERNKSSRKFMLLFLVGASFVLLFLDWYS
ncbi:snare-complex protein syntaxin-18 N-terminus-domain-containing protein [Mycotypha africana]|uniref:snare-complex protein syntaxin-18 N-terminus-domain-containing protein n=1 Tax=Mycotypha africana TaxID=64632 RepID=UPI0022FFC588|nr:snare-complex protein syntaxin-18 N-terminus-domain-containing protein [Mycotypha africana]KAI8968366.1 snare-complex protein syntaxin-18 N-terminus-domain-containing protein [Mycotypha africana]